MTDAWRTALNRQLKLSDLTWEESDKLLRAIAQMRGELQKVMLDSDLYNSADVARLIATVDAATLETAQEMIRLGKTAQLRAWSRGIEGTDRLLTAMEVDWVPGLTGMEDKLVQQFLTVDRIKQVTEDMRALIRGQVTEGVFMEATPFEVMSNLSSILGIRDMAGFRRIGTTGISAKAERIMRTEMMGIQHAATWYKLNDAQGHFPDLSQIWLATGDDRTRDDHLIAHGQVVAVGEPFVVGGEEARFPGDPELSPEQRINCRCDAVPYREEWGKTEDLIGPLESQVEEERLRREEE